LITSAKKTFATISARSCREQKQMTWRLRAYSITSSARASSVGPKAAAIAVIREPSALDHIENKRYRVRRSLS
jgi:hypothetical protein